MKVFKFGGASVKDVDGVKNVASILKKYGNDKLMVIISAMGKTTNKLEELVAAYLKDSEKRFEILAEIRTFHFDILKGLFEDEKNPVFNELENLFLEIECQLEDRLNKQDPDFVYDQLVCYGELISSKILSFYLLSQDFKNQWIDSRNFIITDSRFREGRIHWSDTELVIKNRLKPFIEKTLVVTQGFIGRNRQSATTTLGREGSDYSAAIFAWCLDATSVTIWKDVSGVMNADPKRFEFAEMIDELSYSNAIELAYYGASVIHPKTIQPLQNKNIPLYVKSFLNPEKAGTTISNSNKTALSKPCYILKENQALIQISSKDFSFIAEDHLRDIFAEIAKRRIKMNVMQNSAISFSVVIDASSMKTADLKAHFENNFNFVITENLQLLTVYNLLEKPQNVIQNKTILLQQEMGNVAQYLYS